MLEWLQLNGIFGATPSQVREYLPCSTANNEFPLCGYFGGGEKLCLFTSKAMAALRWFLPCKDSCIIDRVIKLKIFAIPWFSLIFYFFIIRGGGPMAQAPLNKLCLARRSVAERRQNALQAKKLDIFPAGKVWSSSAPPPIFPRSGNSLFGSQTKCARQIYSPLSATAKSCSFG